MRPEDHLFFGCFFVQICWREVIIDGDALAFRSLMRKLVHLQPLCTFSTWLMHWQWRSMPSSLKYHRKASPFQSKLSLILKHVLSSSLPWFSLARWVIYILLISPNDIIDIDETSVRLTAAHQVFQKKHAKISKDQPNSVKPVLLIHLNQLSWLHVCYFDITVTYALLIAV